MEKKIEYEVILDYPNSHFEVGQIITLSENMFGDVRYEEYCDEGLDFSWDENDFDKYPNIFNKL